jgi:hypothetical protein
VLRQLSDVPEGMEMSNLYKRVPGRSVKRALAGCSWVCKRCLGSRLLCQELWIEWRCPTFRTKWPSGQPSQCSEENRTCIGAYHVLLSPLHTLYLELQPALMHLLYLDLQPALIPPVLLAQFTVLSAIAGASSLLSELAVYRCLCRCHQWLCAAFLIWTPMRKAHRKNLCFACLLSGPCCMHARVAFRARVRKLAVLWFPNDGCASASAACHETCVTSLLLPQSLDRSVLHVL